MLEYYKRNKRIKKYNRYKKFLEWKDSLNIVDRNNVLYDTDIKEFVALSEEMEDLDSGIQIGYDKMEKAKIIANSIQQSE